MRNTIISDFDSTFLFIVGCCVVLLLLITIAMIYFVYKFNSKRHPKAEKIHGNTFLEITWTVLPTLLCLVMFFYGYVGFKNLRDVPEDAYVIKVAGKMWKWDFEYPNKKKSDTLYVPTGTNIKMLISSLDVNHSFFIPAFRVKEDAIPGREDYLWFNSENDGQYNIACAEYCGLNHSYMSAILKSIPKDKFEIWVNTVEPTKIPVASSPGGNDSLRTGMSSDTTKTTSPVDTGKTSAKDIKKDSVRTVEVKKDTVKQKKK
ncbi:hypothetical protein BH10BAC5_BH10BAC5_22340 [soil metagenome]